MFSLASTFEYYLYREPTDMRKSFDALSGIVRSQMKRNPVCGEVFIFINRTQNRIKLLRWESGGLILFYKRLEKGTFSIPLAGKNTNTLSITWTQLMMIVAGIEQKNTVQKKRFAINA